MRDYIVLYLFEGGHSNGFFFFFYFFVVLLIVILGTAAMQKEEMHLRKNHLIVTNYWKALDVVQNLVFL